MKELHKWLSIFTGFIIGFGFGDVLKGKEFNQYILSLVLFLLLVNCILNYHKK